ncbi:MAG: DNA-directed RNA polymerase subunit omega [Vicinamibacterales bacterium]
MSEEEIQQDVETPVEDQPVERVQAAPIDSRFLYVDVSALRAKQLRRGAKVRLEDDPDDPTPRPNKPERLAMEEVRQGLVEWSLPEFKAIYDNR